MFGKGEFRALSFSRNDPRRQKSLTLGGSNKRNDSSRITRRLRGCTQLRRPTRPVGRRTGATRADRNVREAGTAIRSSESPAYPFRVCMDAPWRHCRTDNNRAASIPKLGSNPRCDREVPKPRSRPFIWSLPRVRIRRTGRSEEHELDKPRGSVANVNHRPENRRFDGTCARTRES